MRLAFQNRPGEADRLPEELAKFAATSGIAPAVAGKLNLILEELLTNSLKHGFAGGAEGEISIDLEAAAPDTVAVRFRDNGSPFNPLEAAAPDTGAALDDRPIGGLGIHLVRELSRDLAYRRREGFNELSLRVSA